MPKVTRNLSKKIKKTSSASNSSYRWLNRQINDIYTQQAQKENYRSRAAYKLCEIDDKFNIISKSNKILDLGAAPGSWSQVARVRAKKNAQIFALDILEMPPIEGVTFFCNDIVDDQEDIVNMTGQVDLIMSDIAPNFCGIPDIDHLRSMELCDSVLELLEKILQKNGSLVIKVLQGKEDVDLFRRIKSMFIKTKRIKPKASRKESIEIYYVATGFLGYQHENESFGE